MMWKRKLKLICLLFSLLLAVVVLLISAGYENAAKQYAEYDVKSFFIKSINDIVRKNTAENIEKLKNAVSIAYSGSDIASISVDSGFLNIFCADIVTESNLLIKEPHSDFGIPIGNTLPLRMLSGKGFKIKVKTVPLGSVSGKCESKFISAGINQTLHRITLIINACVDMLTPFDTKSISISVEYIVSETVIVGKVPDFYSSRDATP